MTYYDQGSYAPANYATALIEFQKVIDVYPTSPYVDNAWFYIGRTHHQKGGAVELATARTTYMDVIATFPPSVYADNALYYFAKTFHDEGNCTLELSAMQGFLKAYPNSYYATFAQTHIAEISGGSTSPTWTPHGCVN